MLRSLLGFGSCHDLQTFSQLLHVEYSCIDLISVHEMWRHHGGEFEHYYLLGYHIFQHGRYSPMFRRSLLPSSSAVGQLNSPTFRSNLLHPFWEYKRLYYPEDGGSRFIRNVSNYVPIIFYGNGEGSKVILRRLYKQLRYTVEQRTAVTRAQTSVWDAVVPT